MRRQLLWCVVAGLLAGACASAPKYVRPASPVAPGFPAQPTPASQEAAAAADVPWQQFVTDARLRAVIELTLKNNRDLRVAALNVEAAGALYRVQRAELFPTVGAAAGAEVARVPEKLSQRGKAYTSEQYRAAVATSAWELDLFGRVRSLNAAALNQYLATRQAAVATRTSLIAATASAYMALAGDAENLRLAQSTRDTQQASLELIQKSRDAGIASDLDVRQAQSQVEAARAEVARFTGAAALDRHGLELLAGTPVPADLLPDSLAATTAFAPVSAGLSSDVLLRRPDILAREYQLQAANANIGAARAAFFPRISLTAAAGLLSPDLSGLFKGSAATWSFAPQVTAPIFTAGALKANLAATRVEREAAVAQYEKAIQVAFREVSDALALRGTLVEQRQAQEALVNSLAETYRLAEARYKAGIDGYLGVLVAQRALFGAQQALVAVRVAEQANAVTLYKVLGGGV